jgi:hypothetical protein
MKILNKKFSKNCKIVNKYQKIFLIVGYGIMERKLEEIEKLRESIYSIKSALKTIESKVLSLERKIAPKAENTELELKRKYPNIRLDPKLLKLIGTEPRLSLKREKSLIREAVRRYR